MSDMEKAEPTRPPKLLELEIIESLSEAGPIHRTESQPLKPEQLQKLAEAIRLQREFRGEITI